MNGILKKIVTAAALLILAAGIVSCSQDTGKNTKDT